MFCNKAKSMTFRVFDYDTDFKRHDTGKEFTVELEEANQLVKKAGYSSCLHIEHYHVLLTMFHKLYNFEYESGHYLVWDELLVTGDIIWRNKVWFIKRVK